MSKFLIQLIEVIGIFKPGKIIKKSGGLGINIGIHFFDILIWIFGKIYEFKIISKSQSRMTGKYNLKRPM